MQKNIIVLGLGRFGTAVATKLFEKGAYVTAVDKDYSLVEKIANKVTNAIQADMTEEVALKSIGITNYDVAIVATGSDLEASIQATLICKDNGVEKVIAKASSISHARILKKIGADKIVFPENDTGNRLAKSIVGPSIFEAIEFSDDYSLIEVKAYKKWWDKSLIDLDFRNQYQMNVVGFKRNGKMIIDFNPDVEIKEGDTLILIGSNANADRIRREN